MVSQGHTRVDMAKDKVKRMDVCRVKVRQGRSKARSSVWMCAGSRSVKAGQRQGCKQTTRPLKHARRHAFEPGNVGGTIVRIFQEEVYWSFVLNCLDFWQENCRTNHAQRNWPTLLTIIRAQALCVLVFECGSAAGQLVARSAWCHASVPLAPKQIQAAAADAKHT
jgi:hypothetical protein